MTTLSTADARADFSRLITSAATTHERFEVTKNGARAAVILGAEDYDALMETIAVLSDAEAVQEVRAAIAQLDAGDFVSAADMDERLRNAGRIRT